MFAKFFLAAITLPALLAWADPNPIIPGPGDSYKEGGNCMIQWDLDTNGTWTNTLIELKTGDNFNMVSLAAITTVDATKQGQYVYPCPNVTPNSAIYFYEFSSNASTTKYWTTRFTITDQNGNSTPPPQTTQPDGEKIPWGTGSLLDSSSNGTSLPASSSTDLSSPSSSLSGRSSDSSSSSTGSPSPAKTGSTQSNSNDSSFVAVPKVLAFVAGLATTTVAFLL